MHGKGEKMKKSVRKKGWFKRISAVIMAVALILSGLYIPDGLFAVKAKAAESMSATWTYEDTNDKMYDSNGNNVTKLQKNSGKLLNSKGDELVIDATSGKFSSNGSIDTRMRLVNCINLVDVGKKIKSPMQTPDQIEYLKKVILDYNGGADAYGNIVGIYIDAGSGGSGVNIADYLMPDWTDSAGIVHRGLIDKEYSADYVKKFPNAVDKVHLMSPTGYKSEMYEAMIELMNQDKISFTAQYDHKGYLTVFDVDEKKLAKEKERISAELRKQKVNEKEFETKLNEELEKIESVNTKTIKLDWQDEIALANIDALKEELVNMVRKKRDSGKDSFELTPEKANKLHDDRAYTACMASYALMCERRKAITNKKRPIEDATSFINKLTIRKAKYN